MPPNEAGYPTFIDAHTQQNQFNVLDFLVRQILGRAATVTLVQVTAVTPGGTGAPGTVSIHPMVAQIDGAGAATPHGIINNVPYFRLQAGSAAVVIDPLVGDIGIAVFASSDISQVKNTKKTGVPGSRRRFDWADAIYIGSVLGTNVISYVQFKDDGSILVKSLAKVVVDAPEIDLTASTKVVVQSPNIQLKGDTTVTGTLTASVDVVGNGTSLHTHQHGGVTTGTGHTGGPL